MPDCSSAAPDVRRILADLVAFPTVSRDSNLALINYCAEYLRSHGVTADIIGNAQGDKASLHAVVGPPDAPGVILSGHTDVVPVDGQDWSHDPFDLICRDGRLYGRGTADMKGFLAAVLALVPTAAKRSLARPIHLAFSHDEELGCLGVRPMIERLKALIPAPILCIVGEPTRMQVATSHKGKTAALCRCTGVEAHSALAASGVNAIYLANDMIGTIRRLQEEVAQGSSPAEPGEDLPYTTLHVGRIAGGTALNIVPGQCRFEFEIRNLPRDRPELLFDRLTTEAKSIADTYRARFPTTNIEIDIANSYPALDIAPTHEAVRYVHSLGDTSSTTAVSFGTEAGLYQQMLDAPTIVCGPGDMAQGHKRDEYIEEAQLAKCCRFLDRLLDRVSA